MRFRLFFDSSAFYSAVYSSKGAARELLNLSIQGKVWIVVSQDVLDETRRNIAAKAAEMLDVYDLLVTILDLEICPDPSRSGGLGGRKIRSRKRRSDRSSCQESTGGLFDYIR